VVNVINLMTITILRICKKNFQRPLINVIKHIISLVTYNHRYLFIMTGLMRVYVPVCVLACVCH